MCIGSLTTHGNAMLIARIRGICLDSLGVDTSDWQYLWGTHISSVACQLMPEETAQILVLASMMQHTSPRKNLLCCCAHRIFCEYQHDNATDGPAKRACVSNGTFWRPNDVGSNLLRYQLLPSSYYNMVQFISLRKNILFMLCD